MMIAAMKLIFKTCLNDQRHFRRLGHVVECGDGQLEGVSFARKEVSDSSPGRGRLAVKSMT